MNTPPPLPPQNPLCRTCGQGALITRKTFRMSGPVVVIGFILLIPFAVGMLFGVLMLFLTGAASTQTSMSSQRDIRARLAAQDVPEPIVTEVIASEPVGNAELVSLSPQQQSAVHDAQLSVSTQKVGGGVATFIAGGFCVFIIVASFLGGLLGGYLLCASEFCSAPDAAPLYLHLSNVLPFGRLWYGEPNATSTQSGMQSFIAVHIVQ